VFERFTLGARYVVRGAQSQARRLDHRMIGTPHLLLALLDEEVQQVDAAAAGDEVLATAEVLRDHGVSAPDVRRELDALLRRDPRAAEDDAAVLAALGIDMARIRAAVEANFGPGALDRVGAATEEGDRRGVLRRLLRRQSDRDRPELDALRGGSAAGGHLPFTPAAKKALELSLREAIRLDSGEICEEHLLLGLLRAADGAAAAVMDRLEVDPVALRRDLESRLERRRRRSA
jgi:ATP-dependent Clp protease ATP-binding subunit ClpA